MIVHVLLAFLVGTVAGSVLFVISRGVITLLAYVIPEHWGALLFWITICTGFGWLLLIIIEKNTGWHI